MPKSKSATKDSSANLRNHNINVKNKYADTVAWAVDRLYSKSAPLLIGEALLFGVVALLMVFKPLAILATLTVVIGVCLILFGLYRTVVGFAYGRGAGGGWVDVIFGLVNIILGVLFCAYPMGSMMGLVWVFVILFMIRALQILIFAINMMRARAGHYMFDLIVGFVLVGLAILLLFYPMAGAVAVVYYLAVTLLMYAAADVYAYVELMKLRRAVR